jgi:catechol 2,3-dioxygenase-like lactoylglutathione lyase family enzyme
VALDLGDLAVAVEDAEGHARGRGEADDAHAVEATDPARTGRPPYGDRVACRLSEIVVDSRDPEALAAWWAEVLGYRVLGRDEDGAVEIGPEGGFGGAAPTLVFAPVEHWEPGKPRLHLDVSATDRDQDAELRRLLDLGATPADVGQSGQESWHVLADPEGNPFCLLRRRLDPL